jgi:hypothetical protein
MGAIRLASSSFTEAELKADIAAAAASVRILIKIFKDTLKPLSVKLFIIQSILSNKE